MKFMLLFFVSLNLYAVTYDCKYDFGNKSIRMEESEVRQVVNNYYFKFVIKDPQKPSESDDYVEMRDLVNQRSVTYSLKCSMEG